MISRNTKFYRILDRSVTPGIFCKRWYYVRYSQCNYWRFFRIPASHADAGRQKLLWGV